MNYCDPNGCTVIDPTSPIPFLVGIGAAIEQLSSTLLVGLSKVSPVLIVIAGLLYPTPTADASYTEAELQIMQLVEFQLLSDALIEAKKKSLENQKKYRYSHNDHHIVAKRDPQAKVAQTILDDIQFDYVNDKRNLAHISTPFHIALHYDLKEVYYTLVNNFIAGAAGVKIGDRKENILFALSLIKGTLELIDEVIY